MQDMEDGIWDGIDPDVKTGMKVLFDGVTMIFDDLAPAGEIDTLQEAVEKVNLIMADAMPQFYDSDDPAGQFGHAVIQKAIAFQWKARRDGRYTPEDWR